MFSANWQGCDCLLKVSFSTYSGKNAKVLWFPTSVSCVCSSHVALSRWTTWGRSRLSGDSTPTPTSLIWRRSSCKWLDNFPLLLPWENEWCFMCVPVVLLTLCPCAWFLSCVCYEFHNQLAQSSACEPICEWNSNMLSRTYLTKCWHATWVCWYICKIANLLLFLCMPV